MHFQEGDWRFAVQINAEHAEALGHACMELFNQEHFN
jgi:hypothetical protein